MGVFVADYTLAGHLKDAANALDYGSEELRQEFLGDVQGLSDRLFEYVEVLSESNS